MTEMRTSLIFSRPQGHRLWLQEFFSVKKCFDTFPGHCKKLPQCAGRPRRKQPRRKKSLIFHLKANGCFMVMTRTRKKDWIRKKTGKVTVAKV